MYAVFQSRYLEANQMRKNKMILGYFLVIASAVLYGSMGLLATLIYKEGVTPFSLVFLRNTISLPLLALAATLSKKALKINPHALPSIGVITVFGCCITPLLLYISYGKIGTGLTTVFHFVYPAIVTVLSLLFLKSKPKIANLISLAICLGGICVIFMFNSSGEQIGMTGSLLALGSGLTYAIYILGLSGFRYQEISGFVFNFYGALFCAIVSLFVCLFSGNMYFPASGKGWLLCLLFALICNVGAVVLFQSGTRLIGGERASILSAFEPITGVIIGIAFLDEQGGWSTIIGTALVVTSCVLIAVFDRKNKNKNQTKAGAI